jgi:hypothetical protein
LVKSTQGTLSVGEDGVKLKDFMEEFEKLVATGKEEQK